MSTNESPHPRMRKVREAAPASSRCTHPLHVERAKPAETALEQGDLTWRVMRHLVVNGSLLTWWLMVVVGGS